MIRKTKLMIQDPNTGDPKHIGQKLIYAAADFTRTCSEWVRETAHPHKKIDGLVQSSGLKFREEGSAKNELGSLLYMYNHANDVQHNSMGVGLHNPVYSDGHGLHLYPDNFLRAMALFAARKVIKHEWHNNCDEYCAPTPEVEASGAFESLEIDSMIYALFHSSNNCTAVRLLFKGKTVDVHNNMFWRPANEMKWMANDAHYHKMYQDVRDSLMTPHVYDVLQGVTLAGTGALLLQAADDLLVKSMETRAAYSEMHPVLYLDSYNAGWYQLKDFWKEMYPEEFKAIRELHKQLGDELRPRVYELGFLRTYEGMGATVDDIIQMVDDGKPNPIQKPFNKCSACGGGGCDFCNQCGSREEYLSDVYGAATIVPNVNASIESENA